MKCRHCGGPMLAISRYSQVNYGSPKYPPTLSYVTYTCQDCHLPENYFCDMRTIEEKEVEAIQARQRAIAELYRGA